MTQKSLPSQLFFSTEALQQIFTGNELPAVRVMEQVFAGLRSIAEAEFALGLAYAKAGTSIIESCFGVMPPATGTGRREHPSVEVRTPENSGV